jgi:hypothetical protein
VIRHIILNIIGILSATFCCGQDTYVKSFKVFDSAFEIGNSLQIDNENIYISLRGKCNGEACSVVSCLNKSGSVKYVKSFENLYGGNRNTILLNNDTLYHATYSYPDQWYHFIKLLKQNGEVILKNSYILDTVSIDRMNVEGILKLASGFVIHGEFVDINNKPSGIIYWIDEIGTPIRTTTYQLPGNFTVNALQDLQPDGYGNLVFVTVYRDMIFDHTTIIRKLNTEGEVIKDIRIPSDETLDSRPQLVVNTAGQYVFSHKMDRIPDKGYINPVQLVCTDTSGTIQWIHNYPYKIVGQQPQNLSNDYDITQITPTSDGGVVITAIIRTNRIQNRFYDDAYIGKFDRFGDLEWERRINVLDDRDTLYDWCALYDIKEKPDGKGYVAVGSHIPSHDLSTSNILLVSLDADGCIEGMVCDGDQIIVSTLDVIDLTEDVKKVSLFPNPFYDQLNVDCQDSGYLRIVDITGKVMMTQQIVPGRTSIDTSNWSSGMYIVHVQDIVGKASSFKVIKQ